MKVKTTAYVSPDLNSTCMKKNHHVENKSLLTAIKKRSAWHIDMEFLNMEKKKVNVIQLHLSGRLFFCVFLECFPFFCKENIVFFAF